MATVKVDMSGVSAKMNKIKSNRLLGLHLNVEAAKGMERYVPVRDNALRESVDTSKPFMVSYTMPYAHYIWNGISYNKKGEAVGELKYTEPGTLSHWEEHYQKSHGRELAKSATDFIREKL